MTDIQKLLVEVDALLGRISVNSDDVFLMADARRRLKTIFDMLPANTEKKEDARDGG